MPKKVKAIIRTKAAKDFSTMEVQEIEVPELKKNQIRLKMKASRVNAVDMQLMRLYPNDSKKTLIGGVDGSGEIIELGEEVTDFQLGDKVFFYLKFHQMGSWAEEVVINSTRAVIIPDNVNLQDAAAIAFPLILAYNSLKKLPVRMVERILIYGADGAVGLQAVQLAQQMGLQVIAVADPQFQPLLKDLGVKRFLKNKLGDLLMIFRKNPPEYIFNPFGKITSLSSIFFSNTTTISKTATKSPLVSKYVTKYTVRNIAKKANKVSVDLTGIGATASTDAKVLQEASDRVSKMDYQVHPYEVITLAEIQEKGLCKEDVNKVIVFDG